MNPYVVKRTEADGQPISIDIFSKLIEDRILFLHEEIDSAVASQIMATLLYLDAQNDKEAITIYINSPGGDTDGLFAIYDIFQLISAPIKTVCVGEACSAAAILLASGSPGMRYACTNSQVMIHHVQAELEGSKTEIEREVERINQLNQLVVETLSRHTGQPVSVIEEDCKIDKYMSAKEAVKYGIVDKILSPKKKTLPIIKKKRRTR